MPNAPSPITREIRRFYVSLLIAEYSSRRRAPKRGLLKAQVVGYLCQAVYAEMLFP
jgi:hypothetical protein